MNIIVPDARDVLTIGYYQDLLRDRPGAAGSMLALQKLVADLLGAAGFAIGMAFGGHQTVAILAFALTLGGALALWLADRSAAPMANSVAPD